MKYLSVVFMTVAAVCGVMGRADACTGITLRSKNNSLVVARTMDWSREELDNMYVIVPRGRTVRSILPDGTAGGLEFTSRYGFAGLGVEQPEFVIDGVNEAGLFSGVWQVCGL